MKSLTWLAPLVCLGAIGLTPSDALSGSVTLGSHCTEYAYQLATPPPLIRSTTGTYHALYAEDSPLLGLTCPVPIETTLGTSVTFRVRVADYNQSMNLACFGVVYNQNGDSIVTSSQMNSSGQGTQTLTAAVTVNPQSSSYTYGVNCTAPGNLSGINSVRVYNTP